MGVTGLTTFIEQPSSDILKYYILHKTDLIIDGNSVMCDLYRQWHSSSMKEGSSDSYFECFGGNYEIFGNIISDFFKLIEQCNITPYVVFDGGYESKKLSKIVSKRNNQYEYARILNPVSEKKEKNTKLFCLFMFQVFKDIVEERGIKAETCYFEGDIRIATIAREKNCPILSYDSDFYIYGNLYIPFKTIHIKFKNSRLDFSKLQTYIVCKCYDQEHFLKQFNGLQVKSLPILAVLAGNDFLNYYEVKRFCQENINFHPQKNKIESIINWLKNKDSTYALNEIYNYFIGKKEIINKIEAAIKNYNLPDNRYLNDSQLCNTGASSSAININTGEFETNNFNSNNIFHPEFLQKFKRGQYSPTFMNILMHNAYFHLVQVENNSGEHSHKISFSILSAIHKILTNCKTPMTYVGPIYELVPKCNIDLPSYKEINALDENRKQKYILDILRIDYTFLDCLFHFSNTWHLFILTIKYYLENKPDNWPLIYSLIMCKLVLSYVDKKVGFDNKVGFFRSTSLFEQFKFLPDKQETEFFKSNDIQSSLQNITKNDSFQCLKSLIVYFEIDDETKNKSDVFNRDVANSMSEFQSCLLHINDLNTLFEYIFHRLDVRDCINSTFIYNLSTNCKDLSTYGKLLLKAPSISHCFNLIVDTLKNSIVGAEQGSSSSSSKRGRESSEERLEIKKVKLSN